MSDLEGKLPEIAASCRAHGVRKLEIFGSRARHDHRLDSDYDFLVEFCEPAAPGAFDRYFSFHKSLETTLNARVDLVEYAAVRNPLLRRYIDEDRTTVYAA